MNRPTRTREQRIEDLPLPTTDTSQRYPEDQLLRRHGWKIHARPKGEEPIWERNGVLLGQRDALDVVILEKPKRRGGER